VLAVRQRAPLLQEAVIHLVAAVIHLAAAVAIHLVVVAEAAIHQAVEEAVVVEVAEVALRQAELEAGKTFKKLFL